MIVAHLYNDYSGSTSIVADIVKYNNCKVVTNRSNGFIDGTYVVKYLPYKYSNRPTFFKLIDIVYSLLHVCKFYLANKKEYFLFSTILMAPIAIFCSRKRSCLYLMEVQHGPKFIFKFLIFLLKITKVELKVLSEYMNTELGIDAKVVYPSLRESFPSVNGVLGVNEIKNILFIGSKKGYKGYRAFIELSRVLPDLRFTMILNSHDEEDMPDFIGELFYNVRDVTPFISSCDVVVNLSDCTKWKETFGLTIVEAMYMSRIVIAPACGAFLEYINSGSNGFLVNTSSQDSINDLFLKLLSLPSRDLFRISNEAGATASHFSYERMQRLNQINEWSFH